MSDLLAAFAAEQAEEEAREQRLMQQLGAGGGAADDAFDTFAASTSGGSTHRTRPSSSARSRPLSSSSATAASAAAGSLPSAAAAAASPGGFIRDEPDNLSDEPGLAFDSDFQLRPLLWAQLCAACPPAEHAELRRMLGSAAIDANEALAAEVRALLSIASGAQLRHARAKAAAAASSAGGNSTVKSRAALPDSATRQYLAQEVQSLLASLRAQAMRSGVLPSDDSPGSSAATSARRPGSGGTAASANGLAKILPRPETARQQRVLDEMIHGLTRRDVHSAGHTHAGVENHATASSAPGSRPLSGGLMTARPSTARQRSLSSLSPHSSDSPRSDTPSLTAVASTLSHSLLSPSSRPDSARTTLVHELRMALAEEKAALMQDVDYLQACLEMEMESAVAVEMKEKQTAGAATTASVDPVDDAPASVVELRALNEQLKVALQAEEVRSHTLAIMGSVGPPSSVLASPLTARSVALTSPLGSPSASPAAAATAAPNSFAAHFGKSPGGPLKAVRVPSAARVRPTSGPNAAHGDTLAPTSLISRIEAMTNGAGGAGTGTGTGTSASPPLHSGASSPVASPSPPAADLDLQSLMAENADLFSDGPAAAAPAASARATKPVIPTLALGALGVSTSPHSASASPVDHFPLPAGSMGVGGDAAAAPAPGMRSTRMHPSESPPRPTTARSASKARSRIQAAQHFEAQPTTSL